MRVAAPARQPGCTLSLSLPQSPRWLDPMRRELRMGRRSRIKMIATPAGSAGRLGSSCAGGLAGRNPQESSFPERPGWSLLRGAGTFDEPGSQFAPGERGRRLFREGEAHRNGIRNRSAGPSIPLPWWSQSSQHRGTSARHRPRAQLIAPRRALRVGAWAYRWPQGRVCSRGRRSWSRDLIRSSSL